MSRLQVRARRAEAGFTLIELTIAMALLAVGTFFITALFFTSYRLWSKTYNTLTLQRDTRLALMTIAKGLEQASPASVAITTPAGAPTFSAITFRDGNQRGWGFSQSGKNLVAMLPLTVTAGGSATTIIAGNIDSLSFVYPSFQVISLIDVGITARKVPYSGADPIVIQMVQRVEMRNP